MLGLRLISLDFTQLVAASLVPAAKARLVPQIANLTYLRRLQASGVPLQGEYAATSSAPVRMSLPEHTADAAYANLWLHALNAESVCVATGSVPLEIAGMSQLESLQLSKANLSGPLPTLSSMPSLREAILDGNNFTGSVPNTIPSTLEQLVLSGNRLTGSVPAMVTVSSGTSVLRKLDLADNNLQGTLPADLGLHPLLASIRLQGNSLNGSLPVGVSNQSEQQPQTPTTVSLHMPLASVCCPFVSYRCGVWRMVV